jgi:hypothetical protein
MLPIISKGRVIQCIKQKDNQEIKIQSILETIPYFELYFYTFFSYDDVKLGIMETEDDDNDNNDKIEEITTQNQLVSLKYKYIPKCSFDDYMMDKYTFLMDNPEDVNKKSIKHLFDIHAHLVRATNKLIPYHIIHFDINNNNIIISQEVPLIKPSNKCLYLLDYDFVKDYKSLFIQYPDHKPLEMHVIYYLMGTTQPSISISNIYELCHEYETQYQDQDQPLLDIQSGIDFLKTFSNLPKVHIIEELLKYSSTWNQYFVSLFILRVIKEKHYSTTNNFVLKWKEWLHASANIDPRKRVSTVDQLDEIMFTADVKDLLSA